MTEKEDLFRSILPVRVDKSNFYVYEGAKTYIYNETWVDRSELRQQTCYCFRGRSCYRWSRSEPATEDTGLAAADQSPGPLAPCLA